MVEFVADLHPESSLLPKDPVQRAQARFFIDTINNKVSGAWFAFVVRGEAGDALLSGLEAIQSLLPDGKKFAVNNEFTIADVAIAPFLARIALSLENDIGAFAEGEGKKAYEVVWKSPKFAKLQKYYENVTARTSFRDTWDEKSMKEGFSARFGRK